MKKHATKEKLFRPVKDEDIARIHWRGPNGHKSLDAERFWKLVKDKL